MMRLVRWTAIAVMMCLMRVIYQGNEGKIFGKFRYNYLLFNILFLSDINLRLNGFFNEKLFSRDQVRV